MVIATCGHDITEDFLAGKMINISVKDHDKAGNKIVTYKTVCRKCYRWHKRKRLILKNEKQENDWLYFVTKSSQKWLYFITFGYLYLVANCGNIIKQ